MDNVQKQIKKLFLAVIFLCSIFGFASALVAEVYDEEKLLSSEEVELLKTQALEVSEKYRIGVYITIVRDMGEYGYSNIEDFTEYWYDNFAPGWEGSGEAVNLCLSMADRSYDFFAHGDLCNSAFTDYGKDILISDYVLHYLSKDDYYLAFESFIKQLPRYIDHQMEGNPIDVSKSTREEEGPHPASDGAVGLISSILIALANLKKHKNALSNVKKATNANSYVLGSQIVFSVRSDTYSHSSTHTERIVTESSSSSRSYHGGTTISHHGSSHSSGHF